MRTEILKYGRIRDMRIDRGLTQEQADKLFFLNACRYFDRLIAGEL